jgi:hypothetical protein
MKNLGYTNYNELHSYCKCEGLDTEHFLYEIRRSKKFSSRKIIQIMISLIK